MHLLTDPCHTKRCSRGEECIIQNDKAKCICYRQCPDEPDKRFQVSLNIH